MDEEILEKFIKVYNTPAYIFDIKELKKRINYLKNKLPSYVNICYAVKANTFLIKEMENLVDKFEVCSPGEYEICKAQNIEKNKILISGVYKTLEIIKDMILKDDIKNFTIESIEQFNLLKNIESNNILKIIIRITSGNQFGVNRDEAEFIIKESSKYSNLKITGIQYFSGTQKKSIKNLSKELEFIDEFITDIKNIYNYEISELEFGTGFPVQYFQNENFNEDVFLDEFSALLDNLNFSGKITLEIGRSLVASCGKYITKVVDKKNNKGQNYAILDGGINHLVYYGQSMAMKKPMLKIIPDKKFNTEEKWNLCGSLCTVNDIIVKQLPVENLEIGDIFIFENTGAYCVTEGISLFLSRDLPSVFLLKENNEFIRLRDNIPTYRFNF